MFHAILDEHVPRKLDRQMAPVPPFHPIQSPLDNEHARHFCTLVTDLCLFILHLPA